MKKKNIFEEIAHKTTEFTGTTTATVIALAIILMWGGFRAIFQFFSYLATDYQYRDNHCYILNGISHSARAKQGFKSNSSETK